MLKYSLFLNMQYMPTVRLKDK